MRANLSLDKTMNEIILYCRNNGYHCVTRGGREGKARWYVHPNCTLQEVETDFGTNPRTYGKHHNYLTLFIS
jgi:hypothetical protein